jgi:tRNA-dihydrouridine synthase A
MTTLNRRFSVAPMIDWTDRHARYFLRLISRQSLLYTEMITTGALLHGDPERFLRFDAAEHPVALQLGGSDADDLARCAVIGQQAGYDEINLNVGCPSDRVQSGRFGACLMADPALVAGCVAAMQKAVDIPVTVKCRIGIDDQDDYADLHRFVDTVAARGCSVFIVHARKAWLNGLSPKENREIPPLKYDIVYRIKQEFPALTIVINGGIKSIDECRQHMQHVNGVMVGREAYQNPFMLADVDHALFGRPAQESSQPSTRNDILRAFLPYVQRELDQGTRLSHMTRHILGLYHGQPGGKRFRQVLSTDAPKAGAGIEVIEAALRQVEKQDTDTGTGRHAAG